MFKPLIKTHTDFSGLKLLEKSSPAMFAKSMAKGGIQFLNWANNGSRRESRKPPIRWGVLRGSSSVFVGSKLVSVFKIPIKAGAPDRPTPATQHSAPAHKLTFVWNTNYATAMHEHQGNWGKFTQQDGDAGNKWLELHLQRDRMDLLEFIENDFVATMDKMGRKVNKVFLGTGRV